MRTPEEIKKVLFECDEGYACKRIDCPYDDGLCLCNGSRCMLDARKDALAYIQQLEAQVPKWISAKTPPTKWKEDGSTKDLINYQIYSPEYGVDVGNWLEPAGVWCIFGMPVKSVTHWMPLPEPPKEG